MPGRPVPDRFCRTRARGRRFVAERHEDEARHDEAGASPRQAHDAQAGQHAEQQPHQSRKPAAADYPENVAYDAHVFLNDSGAQSGVMPPVSPPERKKHFSRRREVPQGKFPAEQLPQNASYRKPGPLQPERAAGHEHYAEERLRRPNAFRARAAPKGGSAACVRDGRRGGCNVEELSRRAGASRRGGAAMPAPFRRRPPGRTRAAARRLRAFCGRFRRLQSGPLWRMLPHVLFNLPFRRDFYAAYQHT